MSPKNLSNQDKDIQKEKLLLKGKELLILYGIRKTSIEDIMKAVNMAKGSFYMYYESKEDFFFELIMKLHKDWFFQAEETFSKFEGAKLKDCVREFIKQRFISPEFTAFFRYHDEIEVLIEKIKNISPQKVYDLFHMEKAAYERLLKLCKIDTIKVKPSVIRNCLHAVYFGISSPYVMGAEYFNETFEALLNGLILYIFGG